MNSRQANHLRPIAGLVFLIGLSGCASVSSTKSGYLSDYSQLHRTKSFMHWGMGYHEYSIHEPAPCELAGIDSFFIEPIGWVVPENDWLANDPHRKERVSKALESNLRNRLAKIRPIVDTPGPKTARVHAAVTDITSTRTITNILTSIVFSPVSNGGAAIEAEVLSPQGVQLAAITGASHGGGLDIIGYYWRSNHAKSATRRLSRNLAEAIEQSETNPPPPPKPVTP